MSFGSRLRGAECVLLCGVLWGLSGTAAQALFQDYSFPPVGMVAIRMPVAGCLLYLIFRPKFPRGKLAAFALFSVVGLWGAQYTYLLAIDYSNAATGTLLQSLFIPMIAIYEIAATGMRPTLPRLAGVVLAVVGTVELVAGTSGGGLRLLVSPAAVVIGVTSACAVVVFTLASRPLIKDYGSPAVTSWGLLIGSLVAVPTGSSSIASYALGASASKAPDVLGLVLFIALVGTAAPFLLYFKGLESIRPADAGVLLTAEPITAAVASFILLHVVLTGFQYVGAVLIVSAIALAALSSGRASRPNEEAGSVSEARPT